MEERAYNNSEAEKITQKIMCSLEYKPDYYQDLIQTGRIAYLESVRDYRDDKGTKFSTFAFQVIKRKLITYLQWLQYPSHKWVLTGDLGQRFKNGEDMDEDFYKYIRTTLPAVYDFSPEDETEMLKNMKAMFEKNWNIDYAQYRATRKETLEKYWLIILDRYHGKRYKEICKKYNLSRKSLDNILTRIFRCMRRQPKPSDVFKKNKVSRRKPKHKKRKSKNQLRKERTQKARLKKFRGLEIFI